MFPKKTLEVNPLTEEVNRLRRQATETEHQHKMEVERLKKEH